MPSLVQVIVSCLKRDKPLLGPMITMIHDEIFRHYDSENEHDDVSVTVVQAYHGAVQIPLTRQKSSVACSSYYEISSVWLTRQHIQVAQHIVWLV